MKKILYTLRTVFGDEQENFSPFFHMYFRKREVWKWVLQTFITSKTKASFFPCERSSSV